MIGIAKKFSRHQKGHATYRQKKIKSFLCLYFISLYTVLFDKILRVLYTPNIQNAIYFYAYVWNSELFHVGIAATDVAFFSPPILSPVDGWIKLTRWHIQPPSRE